jgi:hypothetical protein
MCRSQMAGGSVQTNAGDSTVVDGQALSLIRIAHRVRLSTRCPSRHEPVWKEVSDRVQGFSIHELNEDRRTVRADMEVPNDVVRPLGNQDADCIQKGLSLLPSGPHPLLEVSSARGVANPRSNALLTMVNSSIVNPTTTTTGDRSTVSIGSPGYGWPEWAAEGALTYGKRDVRLFWSVKVDRLVMVVAWWAATGQRSI